MNVSSKRGIRHPVLGIMMRKDITITGREDSVKLGHAYGELSRFEEASASLKRAIALYPESTVFKYNLRKSTLKPKRPAEALEPLKKAIKLKRQTSIENGFKSCFCGREIRSPSHERRINMQQCKLVVGVTVLGLALLVLPSLSSSAVAQVPQSGPPWGPETPSFNLEVILRGEGFGHVKFRQPNDESFIVYLDVWLRDLAPNTSYLLQRAVDTNVDDNCTSTAWLTLGKGLQPQSIMTDATGSGREELFRILPALPGSEFDIHFQVIEEATSAVVLTSKCYQFTISQ